MASVDDIREPVTYEVSITRNFQWSGDRNEWDGYRQWADGIFAWLQKKLVIPEET